MPGFANIRFCRSRLMLGNGSMKIEYYMIEYLNQQNVDSGLGSIKFSDPAREL